MRLWLPLLALVAGAASAAGLDWTKTFGEARPALYLRASYPGAGGKTEVLEYWRMADGRVVRRTGNRAELRLTPAPDGEDLYQLRNLATRTAYDVHRTNLFRLGTVTDRWSVQHLLDRPAQAVTLSDLNASLHTPAGDCHWFRQQLANQHSPQAALDICWAAKLGVPLRLRAGSRDLLTVEQVQTAAVRLPDSKLPADWHEFNADEDLSPD